MVRSKYAHATDRTRRKIREAFAELLAERGSIKNITVTDLADRADITRGTFYNYFNNLYEVGAELQSEIEHHIFLEYVDVNTVEGIEQYLDQVFRFFAEHEPLYRELIMSDASNSFLGQLEKEINQRAVAILGENGIKKSELELQFIIGGAIAVVRKYFCNEVDLSLEEIRDYLKEKMRQMML